MGITNVLLLPIIQSSEKNGSLAERNEKILTTTCSN